MCCIVRSPATIRMRNVKQYNTVSGVATERTGCGRSRKIMLVKINNIESSKSLVMSPDS